MSGAVTYSSSPCAVFTYGGYNRVSISTNHYPRPTDHYFCVWGSDLSGQASGGRASPQAAMQGAGGVGGLLAVIPGAQGFRPAYYPCYDANGNVTEYVDGNGVTAAHYAYDAYGNTTVKSGPMAGDFNFRFSTKYHDAETGNYYYIKRPYSPALGRFLSEDPIGIQGGLNLYGFCGNDPINAYDMLGLFDLPSHWLVRLLRSGDPRHFNPIARHASQVSAMLFSEILGLCQDPWLTSFLALYFYGDGSKTLQLTEADVKMMQVNGDRPLQLNFHRESAPQSSFFKAPRTISETYFKGDKFAVTDIRYGNLTLGEFSIQYRGEVDGTCTFKGEYRIKDRFDFNWRPWGKRSLIGEARLRAFTLLYDGIPFDVDSVWIKVQQNFRDAYAK